MRHLGLVFVSLVLLFAAPAIAQAPRGPLQRGVSLAEAPDMWLATEDGFVGWRVHAINAHEAAFEISSYTLEVSTEDTRVEVDDLLGQPIVFGVRTGRETFRVRHAHVFSASASPARPEQPGETPRRVFVIDAGPWTRALAMTLGYATFEDVTAVDVLRAVFGRYPFARVEYEITRPLPRRPLVVQYRESDLEIVRRLMHEADLVERLEHRADGVTLVIRDRPATGRAPVIRYDDTGAAGAIEHWAVQRRVAPTAVQVSSPSPTAPGRVVAEHAERPTTPLGVLRVTDHMHVFDGVPQGRRRARALLAAHGRVMRTATGQSPLLEVGAAFTLRGHPDAAENARYRVIAVSWGVELYEHTAGEPVPIHTTATIVPLAEEIASPVEWSGRVTGPSSATVLGPTAGQPHVDAAGRVRVRFHWAPDARGAMPEAWVPIASGAPPNAGDEVVVQFLDGRADRPTIVR